MNQFASQTRVFYNTQQQNDIEMQTRAVRPDMLSQAKLGQLIPHPPYNQYDQLYGHPLDLKTPSETLRPPIEADTEFFAAYPIPYTINMTNNRLIDVAGTMYKNSDLPVMSRRM